MRRPASRRSRSHEGHHLGRRGAGGGGAFPRRVRRGHRQPGDEPAARPRVARGDAPARAGRGPHGRYAVEAEAGKTFPYPIATLTILQPLYFFLGERIWGFRDVSDEQR